MASRKKKTPLIVTEELYQESMQDIVRYMGQYRELNPEHGIESAAFAMASSAFDAQMPGEKGHEPAQGVLLSLPHHFIMKLLAYGYNDEVGRKSDRHWCFYELGMQFQHAEDEDREENTPPGLGPVESMANVVGLWAERHEEKLAKFYQQYQQTEKQYQNTLYEIVFQAGTYHANNPDMSIGHAVQYVVRNAMDPAHLSKAPVTLPEETNMIDVLAFGKNYQPTDKSFTPYQKIFRGMFRNYQALLPEYNEVWMPPAQRPTMALIEAAGDWTENKEKELKKLYKAEKKARLKRVP
ncbi:MAG TPA: hypothetical protein VGF14_05390 [Alphaproteobacteria bacterium]